MFSMQRCFEKNQELVRGKSNLLVQRTKSNVVFKIDIFFVSLKEKIPNTSISKILESLPLKIFSSMLQMFLRKTIFHLKKLDNGGGKEQQFQYCCHKK